VVHQTSLGSCDGTQPVRSGEGMQPIVPTFNFHQPFLRRNTMSHIYNFFDNHGEVWGAVVFGVLAIAACVAMAAALNGAL
jgi:hypothetical protein